MCGVAAWLGPGGYEAVYTMLLGLQHRGHDAAGIAFPSAKGLHVAGGNGFVLEAIPSKPPASVGRGPVLGHVRYSTSGSYTGYQPVASSDGSVVVAFNGNIVNFVEAYREIVGAEGRAPAWDAAALAEILSVLRRETGGLADAVREAASVLRGAYSLVAASATGELVAARDPLGVRPLAYSSGNHATAVASETGVLASMGLEWRELGAGAMLYCDSPHPGSCYVEQYAPARGPYPCAFEYVYLLRPDSVFEGVNAHTARKRMGELLAAMDSVEADIVIPVPDSGRSAALGYAHAKGLILDEAIYVNRFTGRTFISNPWVRSRRIQSKYSIIPGVVKGKRVVVVDDSIVRGSTAARLVGMLRGAGAREVHLRSASPPVISPCFLGVDIPSRGELVASRGLGAVIEATGADTVLYNTVENLYKATGLPRLCLGCFTGSYPVQVSLQLVEERFHRARPGRGW